MRFSHLSRICLLCQKLTAYISRSVGHHKRLLHTYQDNVCYVKVSLHTHPEVFVITKTLLHAHEDNVCCVNIALHTYLSYMARWQHIIVQPFLVSVIQQA